MRTVTITYNVNYSDSFTFEIEDQLDDDAIEQLVDSELNIQAEDALENGLYSSYEVTEPCDDSK